MSQIANKIFLLCTCLLLSSVLIAADEQGEPIYIEADSLDIDDSKGVSTYSGNVHFRQGTAKLWADALVIYSPQHQDVERLIASGKPARFEQTGIEDKEDVSGQAKRIEYHAKESLVVLDGDAQLQQGENQFAGSRIEYDADKKVVRAGKLVSGDKGRVVITLQPRNTDEDKPVQP